MIVKNESRVILRLLNSVVKILDGYCICDTGSTDNTIELITTFFKEHNIPGVIVQEPFKDFGYNRTYALQAAAKLPNMDYLLLLDADMILTGSCLQPENIASFKKSLTKDCYHLCQGTPTYFYKNVRIVKNYKGFSYWGVTHEYVNTPEGTQYDFIDNDKLFIQDIGDGGAKTDKFERDIFVPDICKCSCNSFRIS
jgi:glycosyltransferase involved in cell wall biosynthesis